MAQQPLQETELQSKLKDNVQGDVLGDGFLKQAELFFFFQIRQPGTFRKKLPQLVSLIASVRAQQDERARVQKEVDKIKSGGGDATSQDAKDKLVDSKQANIAFSATGLQKLKDAGGTFDLMTREFTFQNGMESHAVTALKDPPSTPNGLQPKWNNAFLGRQIDGVFLIAGNSVDQAEQLRQQLLGVLGKGTVSEVIVVQGNARQGQLRRHEHFGFLDGVSEPGVLGFDKLKQDSDGDNREDIEDKELVAPGVILCKRDGDPRVLPDWTQDGTFLAFRWLEQKVPEFNRDLGEKFAKQLGMVDTPANRDAIGARIIGRWKSGALITKNPLSDPLPLDKQQGMTRKDIDALLNVNLHVDFGNDVVTCPFGAHIRKMNPRGFGHRIIRRGIQFGPEVSAKETANKTTDPSIKRGLLFACYQSRVEEGFSFIQQAWANEETFPSGGAGIDPMVGQDHGDGTYQMFGMNRDKPGLPITIPRVNPYVQPLGGEYFFVPSITALRFVLADTSAPQPTPNPTPTPAGQSVPCFIENSTSGARHIANVPIDNKSHPLSELWGNGITGNNIGINGFAADNISIEISANGKTTRLPNNQTPFKIATGGAIDLSNFSVLGRKTA